MKSRSEHIVSEMMVFLDELEASDRMRTKPPTSGHIFQLGQWARKKLFFSRRGSPGALTLLRSRKRNDA